MAATIRCDVIDHFSNVECEGGVIVLVKKGYAIEPLEITECLSISKLFFLGKFPYNNNYKFNFISGVIVHRENQNTIGVAVGEEAVGGVGEGVGVEVTPCGRNVLRLCWGGSWVFFGLGGVGGGEGVFWGLGGWSVGFFGLR